MKKTFFTFTLLLLIISAKSQNLGESLLLHYPMTGNAENAVDAKFHLPLTGYTAVPDRFGYPSSACSFNGAKGLVLSNQTVNNQSLAQSVSLWFNSSNTGTTAYGQALFVFVGPDKSRFILTTNNGVVTIEYGQGTGSDHVVASTSPSVLYNDGNWHHAVFVSAGDYKSGKLYLDGELVLDVVLGNNNNNQLVDIKIGGDKVQNYYTGSVDDIRVYARAIDATEVKYLRYEYACTNIITVYNYVTVTDELVIDVDIPMTVENKTQNIIRIYPNPAKDLLTVNTGSYDSMTGFSIEIFNPSGAKIYQSNLNLPNQQINISGWAAGLYLVKIIDNAQKVIDTRKITVK